METPPAKPTINPWTIWVPLIMIMLGSVILYNYLVAQSFKKLEKDDRPPYLGRLEKDLALTERSGKEVHLAQLKGKIIVAGYVYTQCPRGCAAVVQKMKELYDEFGSDPNIQFLSFTVDPEDTPAVLTEFAGRFQITKDNWWFVTGPKDQVRNYLTFQFKFAGVQEIPEKDRLSPADKYLHDMKVALIDHEGHLRGHYDLNSQDPEFASFWAEKVRKDLRYLFDQMKKGKK